MVSGARSAAAAVGSCSGARVADVIYYDSDDEPVLSEAERAAAREVARQRERAGESLLAKLRESPAQHAPEIWQTLPAERASCEGLDRQVNAWSTRSELEQPGRGGFLAIYNPWQLVGDAIIQRLTHRSGVAAKEDTGRSARVSVLRLRIIYGISRNSNVDTVIQNWRRLSTAP